MDKPGVKHITQTCSIDKCSTEAFVQVIVVADAELQRRIDSRAEAKLFNALTQAHKEGLHD